MLVFVPEDALELIVAPVNLGTHFYSSVIDSFIISLEIKWCKSSNFVLFKSCFVSYRTFAVLY